MIKTAHPELFLDLDNDGLSDVYIFIRDNYDESPPAPINFRRDNDQNVMVGAVCISSTMQPKQDRTATWAGYTGLDPDRLMMESVLAYNLPPESGTQATADGNLNNGAAN